ncbi:hypothetical protein DM860_009215 [Cuscuta australis]|uniref:Retrotransposon Copia-like N-terminal domain-containing protein n=1 Tax=Cuscuta australis TaxID=267555 RepID=A0A328DDW5_9ASTE|nr:hypothetical protein DM860_009215 [Cuscuta australis]
MASNNTYSHSINLRYILESQKLSGENFLDWDKNLRIVLDCERKLYILETDPPKTPAANARASELTSFKKYEDDARNVKCIIMGKVLCFTWLPIIAIIKLRTRDLSLVALDAILLGAILGSCTEAVQPFISLSSTSADAWTRLTKHLASMSRRQIISLKSQLAKNTRGNRSIDKYIGDITNIAADLELAGRPVDKDDLVVHIIAAASAELVPTANHAQRTHNGDRGGSLSRGGHSGVSRVGMRGRGIPNSPRGSRYCQFCDLASHDTKFCRKLQQFLRDNNVTITPRPDGPAAHVTVSNGNSGPSDAQWIVDSGASHHVANDPTSLSSDRFRMGMDN